MAHSHSHASVDDNAKRLMLAFGVTATFMVIEVIGGLISGSLALLADAGHMLTDTAALALAWFAAWISQRPADGRRSYGYHRVQTLAAFVNGITLIAIVVWIAIEAVRRFLAPVEVMGGTMLTIAVLTNSGNTSTTRMPWRRHSMSSASVRLRTAALVAE